MASAIDNIKKSTKGRPKTDSAPVMVRLPPEMVEAVEAFRRDQPTIPTRPDVIRLALGDWLREKGYLPR